MTRLAAAASVVMALVLAACGGGDTASRGTSELSTLAEAVCPMLWDWQRDVGDRINHMSAAAMAEPDAAMRQQLYDDTFADIEQALVDLERGAADLPSSVHTKAMQDEIAAGVDVAEVELADLRAAVRATSPDDEPPPQRRVPSFFGEFEKVIDVVKPEIAGYEDQELMAAFSAVPACQFGVKDVDDGVARSN